MRLRSLLAVVAVTAATLVGAAATATAAPAPVTPPVATPDIVGGGTHIGTPYSFMAALTTSSGSFFCGGSLVHARWVVTAKHCVEGRTASSVRVRVNTNNRTSGGSQYTADQIHLHPTADLALVRIINPGPLSPVAITIAPHPWLMPVGAPMRILGWGQACPAPGGCVAPTQLKFLDTSLVPDSECLNINGPSEHCVDNPGGTAGACYGDSGGPLMRRVDGRWYLMGATSRAGGLTSTCAVDPSIYVNVPYFRPWINATTGLSL